MRARRLAELRSVGRFERIAREQVRREVTIPTARVQALWSTFSEIATLSPRTRAWFLGELGRLADEEFGGSVTLPTVTTVYTAQRR